MMTTEMQSKAFPKKKQCGKRILLEKAYKKKRIFFYSPGRRAMSNSIKKPRLRRGSCNSLRILD